eukprot:TRINITY_DN5503_c0_g1_i1.p1 TRINITY_DN5503_c0_g1~~TRINITY_DN5503_c0_g1_i1.p1  ORF type:complete len:121 (-),score=9.29 TRINITY_DN5503_c0_g1_i1:178-501(-)
MDNDPELEAIRARRMAEMQGKGGAAGGMPMGGAPSAESAQREAAARKDAEERRQMILTQILNPAARERLSRIKLVKPDLARQVSTSLHTRHATINTVLICSCRLRIC